MTGTGSESAKPSGAHAEARAMRSLDDLNGKKLLLTGVTGTVGRALVEMLAPHTELYAMSRFSAAEDRQRVEGFGAHAVAADLADPASLAAIPEDIDFVVNLAVSRAEEWRMDMAVNAEGVGHLMARCRNAAAFVHFSTTGVYQHAPGWTYKESDPLGDNHRIQLETYSLSKIAGEQVCRFAAHHFGIPTTIARLNVPYGKVGGFPAFHLAAIRAGQPIVVHPDQPNIFNPIHTDDIAEKIPALLACASTDVTVTNLGGSAIVSVEEWVAYMGELLGVEPKITPDPLAFASVAIDTRIMHELIGTTRIDWRDGIREMVQA